MKTTIQGSTTTCQWNEHIDAETAFEYGIRARFAQDGSVVSGILAHTGTLVGWMPKAVLYMAPGETVRLDGRILGNMVPEVAVVGGSGAATTADGCITAAGAGRAYFTVMGASSPDVCRDLEVVVGPMTTMTLPAALTTLESEAFANGTFQRIVLPDAVLHMSKAALNGCTALRSFDAAEAALDLLSTRTARPKGRVLERGKGKS